MKLMNVSSVEVLSDYKVRLMFTNAVEKVKDLKIYLHGPIFQPMRNSYEAFKAVYVDQDAGTIAWPNGADMDSNVLYYDHLKPAWMVEQEMMLKAA